MPDQLVFVWEQLPQVWFFGTCFHKVEKLVQPSSLNTRGMKKFTFCVQLLVSVC